MFYFNDFRLAKSEKNAVIVFGGSLDNSIPVEQLAKEFDFNFQIFNKSVKELSVKDAKDIFNSSIKPMRPEGMIIHIGAKDLAMFKADSAQFDRNYLALINAVKSVNSKCRIALVSIPNTSSQGYAEMNRHIKAIADSEKCEFVNIEGARLWNPEASKAAIRFAQNMGLAVRKPLRDVAEILYSYAYKTLQENTVTGLAG